MKEKQMSYVPAPDKVECLFAIEAALRKAAVDYAAWINNSRDRTAKGIDDARENLRRAARAYAKHAHGVLP